MAKMLPAIISSGAPRSEKLLFGKLRDDPVTRDWIVLHSFDIRKHVERSEGEADLLVLVPGEGVLCLEVKGCDVSRKDGKWIYAYDPPKISPVGPFKQASQAAHSIRQHLGRIEQVFGRLMFHSAVAFTEIDFKERSAEWDPWQVIGKTDLIRRPISQILLGILNQAHRRAAAGPANWYRRESSRPTLAQIRSIAKVLRGDFEYIEAGRNQVSALETALIKFTEDQFDAIDQLAENARVIFKGPAGTGKTLLAIEAARRSIRAGKSTALLCFNRLLAEWLRRTTDDIAAEAREQGIRFQVGSYSSLLRAVAGAAVPENANETYWKEELPDLAVNALLRDSFEPFSFVVVDEAQDLMTDPFLDAFELLVSGGLSGGNWALFGDFERQAIYADGARTDGQQLVHERSLGKYSSFRLRTNCRNSPRIAEAVTIVSNLSPGYSRVLSDVDTLDVEPIFYRSDANQIEVVQQALRSTLRRFHPDKIVLLSTRSDQSSCAAGLAAVDGIPILPFTVMPAEHTAIRYSSIHSFKGLESAAVIVTDIDRIEDEHSKALLYVGMSRAKVCLQIVMQERLRAPYIALLSAGLRAFMKGSDNG